MPEHTTTTAAPSAARLTADDVVGEINAATEAALEDRLDAHPGAKRDAIACLYLRAIGLGLALIAAELEAARRGA